MTVNLQAPNPANILAVPGVRLGIAEAGVRKVGRKDLTVILLDEGTAVAGVFTQNRYCAAPVQVCREHLKQVTSAVDSQIRALVINTGNANAGTGADGLARARRTCSASSSLSRRRSGSATRAAGPGRRLRRPGRRIDCGDPYCKRAPGGRTQSHDREWAACGGASRIDREGDAHPE